MGILIITISAIFLPLDTATAAPIGVIISATPENPAPGANVDISLKSYVDNLDRVLISWFVNDKNISSGIGKKSFSLNAPKAGEETNVTATISLSSGTVDATVIIRPSKTVLLWQVKDSYAPPFYKGKTLPSAESLIKVVALPEIKSDSGAVNPKSMTYVWKKDYTNNPGGSGYGKNSFTYLSDYLDDSNNVEVTAGTIDKKYSSKASVNIEIIKPKIVFYKKDIRLGTIWELALSDGHKIMGEEVVEAAPYFISQNDLRMPDIIWKWFINNESVSAPIYKPNTLPLAAQAGTSGTAKIKLEINNARKIFENATKEINIIF